MLHIENLNWGQHLWHGGWLQLAELNQDAAVGNLQTERVGQSEDLTKHNLDDDVLQRDLVLQRVGEQLGGDLLPLLEAGHQDVIELLLDEPALNAVLAWEDGALGAIGVVEHAEHDGGERVEGGGVVWRRHQPREVVL